MSVSLANITFDASDAAQLAQFWSSVLELPMDEGASAYFASIGMGARTPALLFIAVPEPPTSKNRVHIDLDASDRNAEVQRVLSLGATKVGDHQEHGHTWTVLADPDGNQFCIAGA
jgi:predicted enzyme related to lactoylglutathione lyase